MILIIAVFLDEVLRDELVFNLRGVGQHFLNVDIMPFTEEMLESRAPAQIEGGAVLYPLELHCT